MVTDMAVVRRKPLVEVMDMVTVIMKRKKRKERIDKWLPLMPLSSMP